MLNSKMEKKFQEMVMESIDLAEQEKIAKAFIEAEDVAGQPEPQYEAIDKPSHYKLCGEDTMPMLEKILGTEGYLGFLQGNTLKYRLRVGKKKGNSIEQDIAKALYYEELYNKFIRENTPDEK